MKKKSFGGESKNVKFNRDIAPDEPGVMKAGVAHPNVKNGAAAVKGKRMMAARGKKRSPKRD